MHPATLSMMLRNWLSPAFPLQELLPTYSHDKLLHTQEATKISLLGLKIQSCEKDSQLRVIQWLERTGVENAA